MSRVAKAGVTDRVVLPGGCQCEGTPHDEDWVRIPQELGYGFQGDVERAGLLPGGAFSWFEAKIWMVATQVKEWNLLNPDGSEAKTDFATVRLLDQDTLEFIADEIDKRVLASKPLPNAFGAPSQDSPPASASPTPTTATPTPASSTTT